MKKIILIIAIVASIAGWMVLGRTQSNTIVYPAHGMWNVQSIDTMKYSRDLSRQELTNPLFDQVIDQQMKEIASTGATHVSIATPYDNEFLPILKRWVAGARAHNLHVWFRGNFSGWEGWFDYAKMSPEQHMSSIKSFIESNPTLFQNGDIFTPCPECENGGPGDPRMTGNVDQFRQFLISEYQITQAAFAGINKQVISNYDSMNADVARLVMDKATTKALGGVITVDHYVSDGTQMASDVEDIANNSGGKIVIGEFGAPIPDIHGDMTETQQANWISDAYLRLANSSVVIGVNYWTSVGGSTSLWSDNGTSRAAVGAVTSAYSFPRVTGRLTDALGGPIANATVSLIRTNITTDSNGNFALPYLIGKEKVTFTKDGYQRSSIEVSNTDKVGNIILTKSNQDLLFMFRKLFDL